jgi:hypothetical protein
MLKQQLSQRIWRSAKSFVVDKLASNQGLGRTTRPRRGSLEPMASLVTF